MTSLNTVKTSVKHQIAKLAKYLDKISHGKITPNSVTITSLIAHVFIALLVADGKLFLAGLLLIVFGLFDSLDGELARLQKKDSPKGMFLDTITDRVKEILLYVGIGFWVVNSAQADLLLHPFKYQYVGYVAWVIAACGISILISYINAWGEILLTKAGKEHETNKAFRGGIMSFEIRMTTLIIGLLIGEPQWAVMLIVVLGIVTAFSRFISVWRSLN